jgi:hypothetical protein
LQSGRRPFFKLSRAGGSGTLGSPAIPFFYRQNSQILREDAQDDNERGMKDFTENGTTL